MSGEPGKHSEEAAEARGVWLHWHNGSDVGSTPGFRYGGKGKAAPDVPGVELKAEEQ